ncbi:MAG: winged helix-turn-helix domain-containing protein, partial [Deferribacteraceae bacterium]|nr:winged helix-turn-helix domain-containing protein [Deferribacteraceae bacterium]
MAHKVSNIDVKRVNRNQVFRYINHHGRLSRPELAKALHMSSPTILFITNELIEKGIIREEGELDSTGGRKAKALMPIHNARCAIGLDITQSHICMVLTDLSGAVIHHTRIRRQFEHSKQYNDNLAELLLAFMDECHVVKERLLGVGLS